MPVFIGIALALALIELYERLAAKFRKSIPLKPLQPMSVIYYDKSSSANTFTD